MKYDIISFGSATLDVFMSSSQFITVKDGVFETGAGICLPLGSKVEADKLVYAGGGGGGNAAVTFARQGLSTAFIGVIGDDINGRNILDELRREGVDTKYMPMYHDDSTAYSVVLVNALGERTVLSYKGEGAAWKVDDILWDKLDSKWVYVNSLGGHLEMLERIAQWAKTIGAHVAVNPGVRNLGKGLDQLAPFWKTFDIVGLNLEEAALVTGIPYTEEDKIFKAMDDAVGGIFILTKGFEGVIVSDGHFKYRAGTPTKEIVERTGAGDAFHSGFLVEFMRSGSIERAIQLATANATSVVMQYGAKAGILRKGDPGKWPLVNVTKEPLV